MKKQLSYKTYIKYYGIVYFVLALLVLVFYIKSAYIALEWVRGMETGRFYSCEGRGNTAIAPYNIDYIVKKTALLDRGRQFSLGGVAGECYYEEAAHMGVWFATFFIILSQLPYGKRKTRELLIQLPLTAKRRYCYETLTNAIPAVGILALVSLVMMLITLDKGYGYQDFLVIAVNIMLMSLFCFSFLTMFKEFHRNPLIGILWGMGVLMMAGSAIENVCPYHGLIPWWLAVLLCVGFLFAGGYAAGAKRMEQSHAIRFLLVRLFIVMCFSLPNVISILTEGAIDGTGMWMYEIVIAVLWAIACYCLTDLSYVAGRIEDLFHPSLT